MTKRPVPARRPWFSRRARLVSVPGLSLPYQPRISRTRSLLPAVSRSSTACAIQSSPTRVLTKRTERVQYLADAVVLTGGWRSYRAHSRADRNPRASRPQPPGVPAGTPGLLRRRLEFPLPFRRQRSFSSAVHQLLQLLNADIDRFDLLRHGGYLFGGCAFNSCAGVESALSRRRNGRINGNASTCLIVRFGRCV